MSSIHVSPSHFTSDHVALAYVAAVASTSPAPTQGIPVAIPRGEVYYWTSRWQADEHESLEAIRRGAVRIFDSEDPHDAVRWLLADDE